MKYFNTLALLKKENDIFKILAIVLAIGMIVMVFIIKDLADKKTVVITPPLIKDEFQVSGDVLSNSYFEQVGFFLAGQMLSVSPSTVDESHATIMAFLTKDPESVKAIKYGLSRVAVNIKENDIYQAFYPTKVTVNSRSSKFSVEGELRKMTGNTYLSNEKKRITFSFDVINGKLEIDGMEVR